MVKTVEEDEIRARRISDVTATTTVAGKHEHAVAWHQVGPASQQSFRAVALQYSFPHAAK